MRLDLSVDDARARLISRLAPQSPIETSLREALGCVLAHEVRAPFDLPKFTNAAMDGIAVRSSDTTTATPSQPVRFRVIGNVDAGSEWNEPLEPGAAVWIGTGAPVPVGADAVIPNETLKRGGDEVLVFDSIEPGRNVRPRGEDISQGSMALAQGTVIRFQEIALLSALDQRSIHVVPAPKVSTLSIGPELTDDASPATVSDVNGPMLAALAQLLGADVVASERSNGDTDDLLGHLDDLSAISQLIITSGGISNSDADSMTALMEAHPDAELWQVRMRPGKHFGIWWRGSQTILALPGNPVAAMVGFALFGRTAIERLAGKPSEPWTISARASAGIAGTDGKTDAVRGRWWIDIAGQAQVEPVENRGSGIVSSLPMANCLVLVPEERPAIEPGEIVQIVPLGPQ